MGIIINSWLVFVIALASVSPVWGGSWGQGPGRGMNYGLGPCADPEVELTPEQASRMKVLLSDYQKSIRPLQIEFLEKRTDLKMCEPGKGKETIRTDQLRNKVRELHDQIREIVVRYKMECRAILTSEQLDRLNLVKGAEGPRQGMGWPGWGGR